MSGFVIDFKESILFKKKKYLQSMSDFCDEKNYYYIIYFFFNIGRVYYTIFRGLYITLGIWDTGSKHEQIGRCCSCCSFGC